MCCGFQSVESAKDNAEGLKVAIRQKGCVTSRSFVLFCFFLLISLAILASDSFLLVRVSVGLEVGPPHLGRPAAAVAAGDEVEDDEDGVDDEEEEHEDDAHCKEDESDDPADDEKVEQSEDEEADTLLDVGALVLEGVGKT